jgi:O-acetylserine/cysteine efflux transporter
MKPTDILLALTVVSIWGFNFVVIKIGLQGLPPILFTALRFFFAAVPAIGFIKCPDIPLRWLASYGMLQFALQFAFLFLGIKLGFPPGLASLVIQLQVFFTIGLAVLLLGDRPRAAQIAGSVIAFGGMGLVAAHLDAKPTVIGFVLVVTAGFFWASANIVTKTIGKVNPLALVVWGSFIAFPPLMVVSYFLEGTAAWSQAWAQADWMTVGAVLFQSYPNTIFGFAIWAMLVRKYPSVIIAPFPLLVPVTGMASAALLLNEPLQWWKIVAGLLVLGGLALNQFNEAIGRQNRSRPRKA